VVNKDNNITNKMFKKYTINAQYTISIDCPEKKIKGKNCMKAKGGLSRLSPRGWEAGLCEWWPKAVKN
jgi:hypothetical protein